MAMPYPEGEVFFKRSTLRVAKGKGDNAWSFNADNAKEFATHILIEYIYNRPCGHGGTRCYPIFSETGGKKYHHPSSFNVMFSKTQEDSTTHAAHKPKGIEMSRMFRIDTLNDAAAYRDNVGGGPDKVTMMPIPIKGKDERYLFIDLVVPVRAIYLPLAHKVDNLDPDLCTYIMIDFRFRKGVEMMFTGDYPGEDMDYRFGMNRVFNLETMGDMMKRKARTHPQHKPQPFSYKEGLGLQPGRTLQVDLRGAYNLLILPRQLRSPEKGLCKPANPKDSIVRNHPESVTTLFNKDPVYHGRAFQLLDYSHVISDHFGVDVTWQPYEYKEEASSLISQVFLLGVETGLSFIPIVGPLISTGFSMFMEAINDPEEFEKKDILKLKGIVDSDGKIVGGDVMKGVIETAAAIAENLPRKGKGKSGLKVLTMLSS
ncbi:hypothetical protein OCS_01105 [Ophiocordyceps sinensis CO18]|uniref:Uncharacterized protein n=1 Tax=Ophiocordyceps sinensis (strain Co18 / CGMCC 3.14243) TaxID=911162 RepID=T5AN75_OPHSC|nr:hypothetical protein OCS_01105 [Ophiocordyceps sinensis CO18]